MSLWKPSLLVGLIFVSSTSALADQQGLKEYSNPGSTAVGRKIDVLAPWGAPTKVSTLGNLTIYYWFFPNPQQQLPDGYTGTIDQRGNVELSGYKPPPSGCEVTVTVDSEGVIQSAKSQRVHAWFCTIPAWYK